MSDRKQQLLSMIRQKVEARGSSFSLYGSQLKLKPLKIPSPYYDFDIDKSVYKSAEFLQYYDVQFIKFSYLALLKRDVDSQGLQDRLEMLRVHKISRVEILGRLRFGSEGKKIGVKVKGLMPAFIFSRVARLPFLGFFIRLPLGLIKISQIQRDIEHIHGLVEAVRVDGYETDQLIASHQNSMLSTMETLDGSAKSE